MHHWCQAFIHDISPAPVPHLRPSGEHQYAPKFAIMMGRGLQQNCMALASATVRLTKRILVSEMISICAGVLGQDSAGRVQDAGGHVEPPGHGRAAAAEGPPDHAAGQRRCLPRGLLAHTPAALAPQVRNQDLNVIPFSQTRLIQGLGPGAWLGSHPRCKISMYIYVFQPH